MKPGVAIGWIVLVVVMVGLGYVVGRNQQDREVSNERQAFTQRMAESEARDRRSKVIIDSLQRVILHEDSVQARLDTLANMIAQDPHFRIGAYRDSSTVVKLQRITGHR